MSVRVSAPRLVGGGLLFAGTQDVILTDDASTDETVAITQSLGVHTLCHDRNKGYGGNQKTCYRAALMQTSAPPLRFLNRRDFMPDENTSERRRQ
jgi:Glycosyl transferase family 2